MLIALTQDQKVIAWCRNPDSGAHQWGRLNIISEGGAPAATVLLKRYLSEVGASEPLCVTGHGNNTEIGDKDLHGPKSWSWEVDEFAGMLASNLPANYTGPILMEVCADSMTSFAAHLAAALRRLPRFNGIWIFGYQKAVSVMHTFPNPAKLDRNVELAGHQV